MFENMKNYFKDLILRMLFLDSHARNSWNLFKNVILGGFNETVHIIVILKMNLGIL